jgi:hypothetical protein
MPRHREVVGAIIRTIPLLILVHHDIQAPVKLVLHAPMGPDHVEEALGGQRCAEQIIRGVMGGFVGSFPGPIDLTCVSACKFWTPIDRLTPSGAGGRGGVSPPEDCFRAQRTFGG